MTNGDKIRSMTDEELQKFLKKVSIRCGVCRDGGNVECPFGSHDTNETQVLSDGKEYKVVAPWCVDDENTYLGARPFAEWLHGESE